MNMILQRLFGTPSALPSVPNAPLADIQQAMREVLDGCNGTPTQRMLYKIDIARKPADLWALRSDLHQCIAQTHTESVAAQRVNSLACLFEGWVPAAQLTKVQPNFRPSQD